MEQLCRLVVVAIIVVLGGCAKEANPDKVAASALEEARQAFADSKYEAARVKAETSIKSNPRNPDAHLLSARIAEKLNDFPAAVRGYVAADATGNGRPDGCYGAADVLLTHRAYKAAEGWIARCIATRPRDKTMKAYRALLEQRLGDSRKAGIDAEEVVSESPGDPVANAVLAEQALRRNDFSRAFSRIDTGLRQAPADRRLLLVKADAMTLQQSFPKAVEIYQALVEMEPTSVEYRVGLAELMVKVNGADDAERVMRNGVSIAPNDVNMRLQLAAFVARHRGSGAAVSELRSAIETNPAATNYDISLADMYSEQHDFDAAAAVLRSAVQRVAPGQAQDAARLGLARLQLIKGDLDAARKAVDELSQAKTADDRVITLRGQISLLQRAFEAAISDFLAVAARQPTNYEVFRLLADAYLQNDQPAEAIAALKRILSLYPNNFDIVQRIVGVQSLLGDTGAALRTVDDFASRNPDLVEARIAQIRLAIQNKEWGLAETVLLRLQDNASTAKVRVQLAAEIRSAQQRYAEAADLYRKLLQDRESGPFDVVAAQSFARASMSAGQAKAALETLTRARPSVATGDLGTYEMTLAELDEGLGQRDAAMALLESATSRSPTSAAPYVRRSALLAQNGDLDGAIAMLDRGRAAGAPVETLLLARAKLQISNGQTAKALATYRELLQIEPASVVAANELANALADQAPVNSDALREARDRLQRLAAFKTPAMIDTVAWISYRLGEFKRAKDMMNVFRADQSANPQIRYHYGAILIALGETSKGEGLIKTTLADVFPGREEAQRMIRSE